MAAYVFYNPLVRNRELLEDLDALEFVLDETCVFCDMTRPETYEAQLFAIKPEDILVLCGGDGTLNRFVNLTRDVNIRNEILYYPGGNQNNVAKDFGRYRGCNPFPVTKWIQKPARIRIGEREGYFLTGAVFDGLTKKRRTSGPDPVYTGSCTSCAVTVDGKTRIYDRVWYLAVVGGKHCTGGFAPDPKRNLGDEKLSLVMICGCGKGCGAKLLRQLRKGKSPPLLPL